MHIPVGPLIRLSEATAAVIAKRFDLSQQARQQLAPGVSSSDYAKSLAKQGLNSDAAAFLAHGLEEKQGVQWAAASAKLVAEKLSPEEVKAMQAAQAWISGAAGEADLQRVLGEAPVAGPGSWAAQAALWSAQALQFAAPGGSALLAPKAIEGAIMLAAGINKGLSSPRLQASQEQELVSAAAEAVTQVVDQVEATAVAPLSPEKQAALNEVLEPFVELGLRIAAGQA